MDYNQWVARVADEIGLLKGDVNWPVLIPNAIDYGEQRMYRELDLLSTVTRDTGTLTADNRNFTLPSNNGRFVVTNGFNVITPVAAPTADDGTRNPLTPVSRDVLDLLWPSTTNAAVPAMFAMITDQTVILGPAPDDTYLIEVIGTIRPTPLSTSNTTTYLTLYLPDAFMAATALYLATKDFGAKSADNAEAGMREKQYGDLMMSVNLEEQRKRYASGAWGSLSPTPVATPSR